MCFLYLPICNILNIPIIYTEFFFFFDQSYSFRYECIQFKIYSCTYSIYFTFGILARKLVVTNLSLGRLIITLYKIICTVIQFVI